MKARYIGRKKRNIKAIPKYESCHFEHKLISFRHMFVTLKKNHSCGLSGINFNA